MNFSAYAAWEGREKNKVDSTTGAQLRTLAAFLPWGVRRSSSKCVHRTAKITGSGNYTQPLPFFFTVLWELFLSSRQNTAQSAAYHWLTLYSA